MRQLSTQPVLTQRPLHYTPWQSTGFVHGVQGWGGGPVADISVDPARTRCGVDPLLLGGCVALLRAAGRTRQRLLVTAENNAVKTWYHGHARELAKSEVLRAMDVVLIVPFSPGTVLLATVLRGRDWAGIGPIKWLAPGWMRIQMPSSSSSHKIRQIWVNGNG